MLKQVLIVFLFQLTAALPCVAQQDLGTIKGRVIDLETLQPIPYASVYINYTTLGVYTNNNGEFQLNKLPPGQHELVISSVGYQSYQSKITIRDSIPLSSLIKLKTTVLKEITVTAKRDNKWSGRLKKFEKLFFGNSEYASQCRILNPSVLDFNEDAKGIFTAQAEAPLVIENLSLGYRIFYQLKNFLVSPTNYSIGGSVRFQEIETQDTTLINWWKKKREEAYSGSSRHLFKSMISNHVKEQGFVLYEDRSGFGEILRDARFLANVNKRIFAYDDTGTIAKLEQSDQYTISLPPRLEVHYLNKSASSRIYTNVSNPVSWIEVTNNTLTSNKEGIVLNPASMTVLGAMSDARIAEILPYDYSSSDNKYKSPITQKAKLPPLAYLIEKPYLHTDKSYYYQKEVIWIKGYMNYMAPVLKDSLSHVIYIELLDSANNSKLKKIFSINNGQIIASLALPYLLPKGDYQLRAYTRWMLNFDSQLIFKKAIKILEDHEFVSKPETIIIGSDIKGITITTDKENYETQDKIMLTIESKDFYDYPIASDLSVSVTDLEQAVPAENEVTILSSYPISKKSLPDTVIKKTDYALQYGIELSGQFFSSKKKPMQGKLTFVEKNSDNAFTIITEEDGRFFFPNLQLYDTVALYLEAKSLKRKKEGITILDSIRVSPPVIKTEPLRIKIQKSKDVSYHSIDTYDMLPAHILEEVTINDTRIDNNINKSRGAHLASDYTISGDWFREINSFDILSSLQSKIPGLRVSAVLKGGMVHRYVYLGGPGQFAGGTEPLILIDGIAVNGEDPTAAEQISGLGVNLIDRIEVIKQGGAASYGARGGNGVIAIYTKKGNVTSSKPLYDKTKLQPVKITGFASVKKFISPDYTTTTKDYRSTIYWNPSVITDEKTPAIISFFAAGIPATYRIVAEGITRDGNPVRGEKIIQIKNRP